MTVLVANVDTSNDTFGQWVSKTNIIADALSTKVVTADSNTTTGNASITGAFSANAFFGNYIVGGNTLSQSNVTFSTNAVFTQNVFFSSNINVTFGDGNISFNGNSIITFGTNSTFRFNTGNTTHKVLTINSASNNTVVATQLSLSDLSDFSSTPPADGSFVVYDTANGVWYSPNTISFSTNSNVLSVSNAIVIGNSSVNLIVNSTSISVSNVGIGNTIVIGNNSVYLSINSTMVAVNGNPALIKVYYANNDQAFP